MSEIRNESLNIWGWCCGYCKYLVNINIPHKNSLDHSWAELMIPACSVKDRKRRGGVRWEKCRLGELVYWFPEPPSSSSSLLVSRAGQHPTQHPDLPPLPPLPLTDSAPTNWLLSCQVTTQPQSQPSQSFVRQNNKLSQTGKRGNKDCNWLSFTEYFMMLHAPPAPP